MRKVHVHAFPMNQSHREFTKWIAMLLAETQTKKFLTWIGIVRIIGNDGSNAIKNVRNIVWNS